MAYLREDELRRLLGCLRGKIKDTEPLSALGDDLRSELASEVLREPEILSYFQEEIIKIDFDGSDWVLRIIPYTVLRMTQRGIRGELIKNLFRRFLEYCEANHEVITIGAYSIFGRPMPQAPVLTLRIDIDEIEEKSGKAHTVTVFVGRGNTDNTQQIALNP